MRASNKHRSLAGIVRAAPQPAAARTDSRTPGGHPSTKPSPRALDQCPAAYPVKDHRTGVPAATPLPGQPATGPPPAGRTLGSPQQNIDGCLVLAGRATLLYSHLAVGSLAPLLFK
ncbi:hypothetical protein NDU88_003250 [Pleurodeles waltl]|uniref:Uncharacterized protein n=1 Tax=Pleurodeles waltl TaxID=8319 RepID=A0AAV7TMZ4_PLEWA|nr:hypothetical protein NDU88_003250 [Pleurodeles waltl]